MKLVDVTKVEVQFEDLRLYQFKKPIKRHSERSEGAHLSDVLKYLYFGSLPPAAKLDKRVLKKEMTLAAAELESAFDPSVVPLKMCLGMAWEAWVVGLYPDLKWQPEELRLNKIYGSMDGWERPEVDDPLVIDEFKLTWKSSRERNGEKILLESLWMWQVKGYCRMAEVKWDETPMARLHVCWVNGDYQHPYEPTYYKYLIEFDRGELKGFWDRAIVPNREKAMEWKKLQEVANGISA